jgi:mono/diheme cytochrome c family protein
MHFINKLSFLALFGIIACKPSQNASNQKDEALVLMEQTCYTCHSPNASQQNRLAPPMIAVKKHYENASEEKFVAEIVSFVMDPTEDKSKMPGAKNRFNLMPKIEYSKENVEKIARYIYKTDIESPEWFEKHYREEMKGNMEARAALDTTLLAKGKKIAQTSQQNLGKNLMSALAKGGPEYALDFCNSKAVFLTDSMGNVLNSKVKRVSDKNRNVNNAANDDETAYIKILRDNIKKGLDPQPKLSKVNGKNVGYYPIETNAMCMQCHGNTDAEIAKGTINKIQKSYPTDKAINYKPNEIRGLWVVEL